MERHGLAPKDFEDAVRREEVNQALRGRSHERPLVDDASTPMDDRTPMSDRTQMNDRTLIDERAPMGDRTLIDERAPMDDRTLMNERTPINEGGYAAPARPYADLPPQDRTYTAPQDRTYTAPQDRAYTADQPMTPIAPIPERTSLSRYDTVADPPLATTPAWSTPPVTTDTRRDHVGSASAPFSFAAGFLGWSVATFFTLALTSLVLAIMGAAAYNAAGGAGAVTQNALSNLTTAGIVGGLIAIFVAYVIGGYNAGRIDRHHGVAQGVAVVVWTIVFGILGAILAAAAADSLNLGAFLAPYGVNFAAMTTPLVISLIIMVLVMLAGAVLGGLAGDRWPKTREATTQTRHYGRTWRGRPRV